MEVTTRYIQMCKNADEIQGRWYPEVGDCVTTINSDKFEGHLIRTTENEYASQQTDRFGNVHLGPLCNRQVARKYYVWLPRIDQLRDCVALSTEEILQKFQKFFREITRAGMVDKSEYRSIWLMFVMWEVHKKIWTGKHWQRFHTYDNVGTGGKERQALFRQVPVS